MPLLWSKLISIRDYIPVADLGLSLSHPVSALPLIGESPLSMAQFALKGWFRIGDQQFIKAVDDEFRAFAWAASDGAFAYSLTGDPYFDDGVTSVPPVEVRPDGRTFDWPSVVAFGRESGDRVLDMEFNHQRTVQFCRFECFWRQARPRADEAPVCIVIAPKINLRLEAQPDGAADGSQTSRSELNPTPSTAGSRR